jgi:hypothetical protein
VASDIFVYWTTTERPSRTDVKDVLHDFFDAAAIKIEWSKDRFFVTLMGYWSHPLASVVDPEVRRSMLATAPKYPHNGRYLEVWLDEACLDVITRHQDEFTHACQAGLAEVFARRWKGRIEK